MELWPEAPHIGRPLPTLPLWIESDEAASLDLEASYLAAFDLLLMRWGRRKGADR